MTTIVTAHLTSCVALCSRRARAHELRHSSSARTESGADEAWGLKSIGFKLTNQGAERSVFGAALAQFKTTGRAKTGRDVSGMMTGRGDKAKLEKPSSRRSSMAGRDTASRRWKRRDEGR